MKDQLKYNCPCA